MLTKTWLILLRTSNLILGECKYRSRLVKLNADPVVLNLKYELNALNL